MADDRIMDRIAKLLALSESPNEHEARAASEMAARMMAEHGVGRDEVMDHASRSAYYEKVGTKEDDFTEMWKFALVVAASNFCGVSVVAFEHDGKRRIKLAGRKEDVDRALAFYHDLIRAVRAAEKTGVPKLEIYALFSTASLRQQVDSYRRGVVHGVSDVLTLLWRSRRPAEGAADPKDGCLIKMPVREEAAYSSRVRARYQSRGQDETREHLDDVADRGLYKLGRQVARSRVVVGSDLSVEVVDRDVSGSDEVEDVGEEISEMLGFGEEGFWE